ncbi:MAG: alpha-galactosidase [Sedimentisphaerales bacterium]|nr:alpha-galactosidase [Sedimentisphaerales bacterium]
MDQATGTVTRIVRSPVVLHRQGRLFDLLLLCVLGLAGLLPAGLLRAVAPTVEEFRRRDERFGPLFGRLSMAERPHLKILYEDVADGLSRGRSWRGTPFQIGQKTYAHGLQFNSIKHLLVETAVPAERFRAQVGLENNDDTRRGARNGQGSVTFHVLVEGKEVFASPVMRLADEAITVDVPLAGARRFEIRVGDGQNGRGWDQGLWGEAEIRLRDGSTLRLEDLPLDDEQGKAFSLDAPPFSFLYDGKSSTELLGHWQGKHQIRRLDERRTEHTLTYADPAGGLQVRCVMLEYLDFPTVEWTVYFRNNGSEPTPLLEDIQALDLGINRPSGGEFLLHHNVGAPSNGNDYGPLATTMPAGAKKRLAGAAGRPTGADWSYFNLEYAGDGLIVAVGWPGQWAAEFARDNGRGLLLRAGQERTRLRLLPGEEIRSPLIVLQFWRGDWIRAQNVWRRWMVAHCLPRPGGRLPTNLLFASSSRQYDEMINANETNQIMFIDRYLEEKIPLDYWWMDAGWYEHHGGGWPRVGTWQVDKSRFARGLRAVCDHAHAHGLKTLLWFEPERVTAGTWLADNHPEWILGGSNGGLLNLGDDAARHWLTDHVDRLLGEEGIDLYRQDFNMEPLNYWRGADAADRQGISEIRHVTGYLAYWDELRRRHPEMLIDSCASGGRRNDLETMRRAVPLWRSDYAYEAVGHQCMMYGLSLWLPYHGTGTVFARNASYYGSGKTPVESYAFWSNAGQGLGMGIDVRIKDLDYDAIRRLIGQWRQIAANYYGDFYPLTPWSRDETVWMAWQFDRPEAQAGMVQVFRRAESFYETARLRLSGLDADGTYLVGDLDTGDQQVRTGRELLEEGLPVTVANRPGVAVLTYQRQP